MYLDLMQFLAVFRSPIELPSDWKRLLLVLPLCLAIAAVHKAVKLRDMRRFPREFLLLSVTIVLGIAALAFGLWALAEYWPL